MIVRRAGIEDLPQLQELQRQYYEVEYAMLDESHRAFHPGPGNTPRIADGLSTEGTRVFVVEDNKQLVGYATAILSPYQLDAKKIVKQGKLKEIFLKEKWRKKGLASELFEHAVAWFRECGCEYVALVVFASNPAKSVYEHWGLTPFFVNMKKRI